MSVFPSRRPVPGLRRAPWRVLGVLASALAVGACGAPPETDLEALWALAHPFDAAVESYGDRGAEWRTARTAVTLPPWFVAGLDSLPGRWRLLVVAESWCGDSLQAVPWLDGFTAALPGVELRVLDSRTGRSLMDRHRTPDGRRATPTLVLLDERGRERGCWVERPTPVQDWWLDAGQELALDTRLEQKRDWWRRDRGYHLLSEVEALLWAASRGSPVCRTDSRDRSELPDPGWPDVPFPSGAPS